MAALETKTIVIVCDDLNPYTPANIEVNCI
jgi:hypothetical protein